jgi:hypothetical protein
MARLVFLAVAGALMFVAVAASILTAEPIETREIVLKCGRLTVRVDPVASVAHLGFANSYVRSRANIDPRFIAFETIGGKMRIDRETSTYSMLSNAGAGYGGTCRDLLDQ